MEISPAVELSRIPTAGWCCFWERWNGGNASIPRQFTAPVPSFLPGRKREISLGQRTSYRKCHRHLVHPPWKPPTTINLQKLYDDRSTGTSM